MLERNASAKGKNYSRFGKGIPWLVVYVVVCLFFFIFLPYKVLQFILNDTFLLSGKSTSTIGTITQLSTAMNYSSTGFPPTSLVCHGKVAFQPAEGKPLTIDFDGIDWEGSMCAETSTFSQVTVDYNPQNPSDAGIDGFIRQDFAQQIVSAILLGCFLLCFLVVCLGTWLKAWSKRRHARSG